MQKEKFLRIHRIYSIVLSIIIAITGICFMIACGCIYYSGGDREQIYTVEIITEAFKNIAIPVYVCLAMILISFIFEIFAPLQFKKGNPNKPYAWILERLNATKNIENCDKEVSASILSLRAKRKRFIIIRSVLLTASSLIFLIYALNGAHFDNTDINGSMIRAVSLLAICMAIPFVFSIITSYYCRKSMQAEIELLKQAPARDDKAEDAISDTDRKQQIVQISLLVIGLGFVVYGLCAGGTADVLTKAINICTECIGLG